MTKQTISGNRTDPLISIDDKRFTYTPEVSTNLRRTFREKYGWIGPEEKRLGAVPPTTENVNVHAFRRVK